MFKKFSALLLALPLISALQLNPPTGQVYSSSPLNTSWTTTSGDPATFDLYLTNNAFGNTFALSNTVTTSNGNITVNLPVVPAGSGYTLQASRVGDVSFVLSQTTSFTIDAALSSSLSSSSGTGSPSSTGLSSTLNSIPLTTTSSKSSSTVVPTGSFNGGSNGAINVVGIGATVVGVLVAAGAFFAL